MFIEIITWIEWIGVLYMAYDLLVKPNMRLHKEKEYNKDNELKEKK